MQAVWIALCATLTACTPAYRRMAKTVPEPEADRTAISLQEQICRREAEQRISSMDEARASALIANGEVPADQGSPPEGPALWRAMLLGGVIGLAIAPAVGSARRSRATDPRFQVGLYYYRECMAKAGYTTTRDGGTIMRPGDTEPPPHETTTPAPVVAAPPVATPPDAAGPTTRRLDELNALRARGLVTDEEYEEKRREILQDL